MTDAYLSPRKDLDPEKVREVLRSKDGLSLGFVRRRNDGWRFFPGYQRRPSRKGWGSPEAALKSYRIRLRGLEL